MPLTLKSLNCHDTKAFFVAFQTGFWVLAQKNEDKCVSTLSNLVSLESTSNCTRGKKKEDGNKEKLHANH